MGFKDDVMGKNAKWQERDRHRKKRMADAVALLDGISVSPSADVLGSGIALHEMEHNLSSDTAMRLVRVNDTVEIHCTAPDGRDYGLGGYVTP